MKRIAIGTAKHVARALGYGVVGAVVVLIGVAVVVLEQRPDLQVWHTEELDEEFREEEEQEEALKIGAQDIDKVADADRDLYAAFQVLGGHPEGRISKDERVVLFNCGSGLKYDMPRADAALDLGGPIDYAAL